MRDFIPRVIVHPTQNARQIALPAPRCVGYELYDTSDFDQTMNSRGGVRVSIILRLADESECKGYSNTELNLIQTFCSPEKIHRFPVALSACSGEN